MPRGAEIVPVGAMHVTKLFLKVFEERTPCQSSPAWETTSFHSEPSSTEFSPIERRKPLKASSEVKESDSGRSVIDFDDCLMPIIDFNSSFAKVCMLSTFFMLPLMSGYFEKLPSIAPIFALKS